MNCQGDFGFHWCRAQLIGSFAAEPSVIIRALSFKTQSIARFTAGSDEREIDFDVVLVPNNLSKRIATSRDAHQIHFLARPHRFSFDITQNFGRSGRICKKRKKKSSSHFFGNVCFDFHPSLQLPPSIRLENKSCGISELLNLRRPWKYLANYFYSYKFIVIR